MIPGSAERRSPLSEPEHPNSEYDRLLHDAKGHYPSLAALAAAMPIGFGHGLPAKISPCAVWLPSLWNVALKWITSQFGFSFIVKASALKKSVLPREQDRPDIARKRARWKKYQGRIDAKRLVFLDETWAKTNMAPLRGWFAKGERLHAKVPNGHWSEAEKKTIQ